MLLPVLPKPLLVLLWHVAQIQVLRLFPGLVPNSHLALTHPETCSHSIPQARVLFCPILEFIMQWHYGATLQSEGSLSTPVSSKPTPAIPPVSIIPGIAIATASSKSS